MKKAAWGNVTVSLMKVERNAQAPSRKEDYPNTRPLARGGKRPEKVGGRGRKGSRGGRRNRRSDKKTAIQRRNLGSICKDQSKESDPRAEESDVNRPTLVNNLRDCVESGLSQVTSFHHADRVKGRGTRLGKGGSLSREPSVKARPGEKQIFDRKPKEDRAAPV